MKYDTDVDPSGNTSHALMLEMVGTDKRVLDVGCATGYLARALVHQGCTVSGVEIDPDAAEEARPILKELVVGNLETLDLREVFEPGAFDAIVFGDVLEHLTDPLAVLRMGMDLLTEDGFVVVSIPNVAHGAVRLSLLEGRFEYQGLGLLDATHLRFFTRDSVEALLGDAGLVAVDIRRTIADYFETEIEVARDNVPSDVLARLNDDPEGRTYQFVVKAIPVDASPGVARLHQENAVLKAEVERLRRAVGALAGPFAAGGGAQVGLWGHFGLEDLRSAVLPKILRTELARRLPGSTIRCFAPSPPPSRIDVGEPIEPLGPWDAARAEELAAELDAVVVTGRLGISATSYSWSAEPDFLVQLDAVLSQGLGPDCEQRCPMLYLGVEASPEAAVGVDRLRAALLGHRYAAPCDSRLADRPPDERGAGAPVRLPLLPDPLFLVGRVLRPELLRHRASYLRLMGWFPRFGPVILVEGDRELTSSTPALARILNELAADRGARCAVVESKLVGDDASFAVDLVPHLDGVGAVMPIDAGLVDILAAVANAEFVVASSASLLVSAFALGRPCVGLDLGGHGRLQDFARATGLPDAIVAKPTEIAAALAQAPSAEARRAAQRRIEAELDHCLDEAATLIATATANRRASGEAPVATASLASRLAAAEEAHAGIGRRLAAERMAFSDRAEAFQRQAEADLAVATTARAEAEARLAALYATRTLRVLEPARQIYGRLRARRP